MADTEIYTEFTFEARSPAEECANIIKQLMLQLN